ncbi:hypothetical protein CLAIMM_04292 [Cladophialophora immunda]|nr:hypothetical protein CLAIMM_04292 [Cladophialophora immunda]
MHNFEALKDTDFDYVVVGGGTSGCLIASRLATELPDARVLLVEAGPDDSADPDNLVPGLTKPKFGSPDGNWLYRTAPQRELRDREIVYPRGKGLGGCSANNFMAWVKGSSADYDDWAGLVDDSWWRWENVKQILNQLEDFRPNCPAAMERYANPTPGSHGKNGQVWNCCQFNTVWQDMIIHCLQASEQAGHRLNADNNDGDPVGFSVAQFSVRDGVRVTSANAFLDEQQRRNLPNLTVTLDTLCSRIIFRDNRAHGVELIPSRPLAGQSPAKLQVRVRGEVIITAGTFQSAQLLLLSGVGPRGQLEELGIPVVVDLPGVGEGIRDHSAFACEYTISPEVAGHNQLLNSSEHLRAAEAEYASTKTGPLSVFGASAALIFPRLEAVLSSSEFHALDKSTREYLQEPTRPSTEIWMHSGPLFYTGPCAPDESVLVVEGLNQNCLSRGRLKLRSRNPYDLPAIDPQYLTHPLDRRVAIETVREILNLTHTDALSRIIQKPLLAPSGESEEALDGFIRDNLTQGFHSMGSCVMGRHGDPRRVVDNKFEVVGTRGLRVADMSVCPILTCNHTQINAYLIGIRCAELVVRNARGASATL